MQHVVGITDDCNRQISSVCLVSRFNCHISHNVDGYGNSVSQAKPKYSLLLYLIH